MSGGADEVGRSSADAPARLNRRQVVCSLLVALLFSPVVLGTGSARFRTSLYEGAVVGVPVFALLVLALLVVFIALVWVFAGSAFSDPEAEGGERP